MPEAKPVRPFNLALVEKPEALRLPPAELMKGPVDLEIGCGVGWHPIRYALANPGRSLIAIEHTRAKFERFESRLAGHEVIPNLFPVHADAVRWVSHALTPGSIDRCFLHYPNPEPKAANKRWFRMPFMHRLIEILKPGGEIVLATNEEWYWQEALEWAEKQWGLVITDKRSFKAVDSQEPRTHFERKYLQRGETCFDLSVRKP